MGEAVGQEQHPKPLGRARLSCSASSAVQLAGTAPVPLTHPILKLLFVTGVGWISWLAPQP